MRCLLIALAIVTCASGCKGGRATTEPSEGSSSDGSSSGGTPVVTDAHLALCLSETNRLRATVGRPALVRSASLDAFALQAATSDAASNTAHAYVHSHLPAGMWGENQLLNWNFANFGTIDNVIRSGWQLFWSEGPGGGHYETIRGPFTQAGCGIVIVGGSITVVQDFR